jgi:hypothetical protein
MLKGPGFGVASILGGAGLLWMSALSQASGQQDASPQSVNECTLLTNPAKLQQCIIESQGGRPIPGRLTHRHPPPLQSDTASSPRPLRPPPPGPPP